MIRWWRFLTHHCNLVSEPFVELLKEAVREFGEPIVFGVLLLFSAVFAIAVITAFIGQG